MLTCQSRVLLDRVAICESPHLIVSFKRIKLTFSDSKPIVIPKAFVGSTFGWSIHDVYQSVRDILPELNQDCSGEILSLVSEGHKIKAIDLVRRQYGMGLSEAKAFVEDLKPNNGIQPDPRTSGR